MEYHMPVRSRVVFEEEFLSSRRGRRPESGPTVPHPVPRMSFVDDYLRLFPPAAVYHQGFRSSDYDRCTVSFERENGVVVRVRIRKPVDGFHHFKMRYPKNTIAGIPRSGSPHLDIPLRTEFKYRGDNNFGPQNCPGWRMDGEDIVIDFPVIAMEIK
jgi:hypothetical protein